MSLLNEELRVVVRGPGRPVCVHVEGELDCASAPRLHDVFVAIESQAGDVDVDMSLTTFCDSAGLCVLLAARRQLQLAGRRLRIVHASRQVLRLLELSGTGHLVRPLRSDDATPLPSGQASTVGREAEAA